MQTEAQAEAFKRKLTFGLGGAAIPRSIEPDWEAA
jgi:hypothetical protein